MTEAKAVAVIDGDEPIPSVFYGPCVSGVTRNGTGDFTIRWATPFLTDSSYGCTFGAQGGGGGYPLLHYFVTQFRDSVRLKTYRIQNGAHVPTDPDLFTVAAYGQQ